MQPELILTPFGENANPGTINDIPESLNPSDPVQSASWQAGFPLVTMTPLSAGGIPPRGQDVNGALRAISRHSAFLGGGGQYKWSAAYVAAKGGYSIGDVIQGNDGLNSYVSLVNSNSVDFNSTPSSIGTSWGLYSGQALIQPQATETVLGVVRLATTPVALAGTDDVAAMTSLKVKRAIDQKLPFVPVQQGGGIGQNDVKLYMGFAPGNGRPSITVDSVDYGGLAFTTDIKQATESVLGLAKIASQTQTNNGADDSSIVTPLKLKNGVLNAIGFTPVQQGGGTGQGTNKVYLGYATAISRPSIVVDSTNYGGVAFLSDLAVMPITKQFLSTQQAFVNGGLVSVSHGLGVMPKIVMGELVCLVAENGWQVGDVQVISLSPDNDDATVVVGFAVRKDAVSIYARCGVSGPYGVNINTGANAVPTAANWRLVLRAFA